MTNFDRAQNLFDHIAASAAEFQPHVFHGRKGPAESIALPPVDPEQIPIGSGVKGFIKRCLRKCVGWYVRPAFYNQRLLNASMARSLSEMSRALAGLSLEIEKLSAKVDALREGRKESPWDQGASGGKETAP